MATVSQVTEAVFRSRFDDQMSAGAAAAAKAMQDLGARVVETDAAVTRVGKSASQIINTFDPVTKATRNLERAQRDLAQAQKTLAVEVAAGGKTQEQAARATEALAQRVGKARADLDATKKAYGDASGAIAGLGNTTRLTARELQQLSPQIADVGVTLAGGMNPLMVLIQQGPQIVDAVGGVGRAFALLRAAITPTVAAVAAASVAIVGSIAVAESQERALAGLSNRLRATRNDYQALAASVDAAARAAAGNSSLSTGDARGAGQIIAGQRNFSGGAAELQRMMELSGRLATVMGSTVPEAAERLASALARPGEAARRMADDGLRTMDEGLLRTIQRFENQGNVAEAARLAIDAYGRAASEVAKTPLQAAMDNLSQAFSRLWNVLRPVADLLGGAMAQALAFIVNRIAAMVSALAELGRILADSRVSRFFFGEVAPAAPAEPQESPTQRAARLARQANPAMLQRREIQDRMTGLRAGLDGASPEDARLIRDAMRELQAQMEGMTPATEQYLRGLREQAELAGVAEGAARELAQADMEVDRAARAAGLGQATVAEREEARRLTQQRLRDEMLNGLVVLNREITGQQDIAAAYGVSAQAGREAEARHRARVEALRGEAETLDGYERLVETLTARYLAQAEALRDVRDAQALLEQGRQLEYIQAETAAIGLSAVARERELAALRERQRIIGENGDPDTDRGRQRIANAEQIAEATLNLQRQRDAFNELARIGEQAFDRIGSAITEAFVNGNGRAIDFANIAKAMFSEIIQAGLRLAVLNPVINSVFGQNRATAFDVIGGAGGGAAGGGFGGGMGGIGNLLGLGQMFGGGGITGAINGLGVSSGLFGNGVSFAANSGAASYGGFGLAGEGAVSGLLGSGTAMQFLGGVGGGFALGSLLSNLTATSPARQTNGMIGSGGGALAGALIGSIVPGIGTIAGGLLGGAGGGLLGGLIGPGAKTNAFGYSVTAADGRLDASGLRMTGDGAGGEQALAQARQATAAINALMASAGVVVRDMNRVVNGQVNSEDQSATFGDTARFFRFSANDNRLNTALSDREFGSFDDLGAVIQQVQALSAALDAIANPVSAFQQGVNALANGFDAQIAIARDLGFGEAELRAEREKQINALFAQRDAELAATRQATDVMRLMAEGREAEAQAIERAAAREPALAAMRQRMVDLGLSADEAEPYVRALAQAMDAQSAAAARSLQEERYVIQRDLDLRYNSTRAGLNGNAQQQLSAAMLEAAEKARQEVNALAEELTKLGFPMDLIAVKTAKLSEVHLMEAAAMQAAYDARVSAARQSLDDRLFNATADTSTVAGALAAYDRQAARERLQIASEGLVSLTRLERVQAAERLKIIEDFSAQANAELRQVGGGIRSFIDSLAASPAGGLSIPDQFRNAQDIFGRDLTLARGGDRDALGRISSSAQTLLGAGQSMFASGPQFQALRAMVVSSLESLPAVQSYDALVLEELRKLGGAVNVRVELEAIRVITESLNALSPSERAMLVQSTTVTRRIEEQMGRALTAQEVAALVAGGSVLRSVSQSLGRDLTAAERAQLITEGVDNRRVQQLLGRELTAAERASLVAAGDVMRTVSQALGRGLTNAEANSLIAGGPVVRSIEQQLGRRLTAGEVASIVESKDVMRTVSQIIGARTGAALVLGGTVVREVAQQVETTETVQISRSIDDKLSGLLRAINSGIVALNAVSQAGFASVAQSVAQGRYVSPGQALAASGMLPGGGASNADFVRMLYRTFLRREADVFGLATYVGGLDAGTLTRAQVMDFLLRSQEMYGTSPTTQQALAGGGWVGNGTWNRDSVVAAYAGGGNIALAGGEYVMRAPMAARYADVLPSMNAGTFAANDDRATVRELRALRVETAELRREMAAMRTEAARGAVAAERTANATEDTAQTNRAMARDGSVVGARPRRAG